MKSYLLKSIYLVALVAFLGCSNDDAEDLIEETQLEVLEPKKKNDTSSESRLWPNSVIVYVECPTGLSNCWSEFNNFITVYASVQSTVCPGMQKVWVDATEYYALYPDHESGVNHVLREPFGVRVPSRLTPFDENNCFPQ